MSINYLSSTLRPAAETGSGKPGQLDGAASARNESAARGRIKTGGPLPLAEAAQRLRGRPGRSRKGPERRHVAVTSGAQARVLPRLEARPSDVTSNVLPRLLGVEAAGRYLGVSPWTIRDLVAAGQLQPVRLSLPSGKAVRRLLFDRVQLDLLIEAGRAG